MSQAPDHAQNGMRLPDRKSAGIASALSFPFESENIFFEGASFESGPLYANPFTGSFTPEPRPDLSSNVLESRLVYADALNDIAYPPQFIPLDQVDINNVLEEPFYTGPFNDTAYYEPIIPGPDLDSINGIAGGKPLYTGVPNAIAPPLQFEHQLDAINGFGFAEEVFYAGGFDGIEPLLQPIPEVNFIGGNINGGEPNGGVFQPEQAIQALVNPMPVNDDEEINGSGGVAGSQEVRCGNYCGGNLIGPHQCTRYGRGSVITCSGGNDCRSTFKKAHAFNRHYKAAHTHTTLLECPYPGCDRVGAKGFNPARKDNFNQHKRTVHGEEIAKVKVRFGHGRGGVRGL